MPKKIITKFLFIILLVLSLLFPNLASAQTIPVPPSNLVATTFSATQIDLTWQDNSDNEWAFKAEYSTLPDSGFKPAGIVGANVVTRSVINLQPNTTYYFRVYAYNNIGSSDYSNVASSETFVRPIYPPEIIGTTQDIKTDGTYLYLASELGLVIADLSPKGISRVDIGFEPFIVSKDGNLAVLASKVTESQIAIVDVSNPYALEKKSQLTIRASDLVIKNIYIYVINDNPASLTIINASNPTNPTIVSELQLEGTPQDIDAIDENIFIAAGDRFLILNVRIPNQPFIQSRLIVPTLSVAVKSSYAYIAPVPEFEGIQAVNISDPANPQVEGQLTMGSMVKDMVIDGNKLNFQYKTILGSAAGLGLIDISIPASPRFSGAYRDDGVSGVTAFGNFSYLVSNYLKKLDSSGARPVLVAQVPVKRPYMSITKQQDVNQAQLGQTVTYTLNYNNIGSDTAINLTIQDIIPTGTSYIDGSATSGGTFDGTKIIWSIGNFGEGDQRTVNFQVRVQ